jgi:hypothetical protein
LVAQVHFHTNHARGKDRPKNTSAMNSGVVELKIELDREVEPISGRFAADGQTPVGFRGWIALAALLEQARRSRAPTSDRAAPHP